MKQVVSLSGGKDSTAMLLMMLERGESVDEVVIFDTGWEFPEMYEHIDKLEREVGMRFTRLHPATPLNYQMFDRPKTRGKRKGERGYGWAMPMARWCTAQKNAAIKRHVGDALQCVGIAADEKRPLIDGKRYPLIEWGVTESDALAYCYAHGFDWDGLYERKKRVSCWCCPLQSLDDLRVLRKRHPRLWEELMLMDKYASNQFRSDYSVKQLEDKFAQEDTQLSLEWLRGDT